jgi:hypothetical protein
MPTPLCVTLEVCGGWHRPVQGKGNLPRPPTLEQGEPASTTSGMEGKDKPLPRLPLSAFFHFLFLIVADKETMDGPLVYYNIGWNPPYKLKHPSFWYIF